MDWNMKFNVMALACTLFTATAVSAMPIDHGDFGRTQPQPVMSGYSVESQTTVAANLTEEELACMAWGVCQPQTARGSERA